ncbi:MAG: tyrosine-type recombinase/integrase [Oscillospiraceae bacterium]|nr:tyrosine-type recombinase/integrase [Oscillospiraceae bacterium]
MINYKDDSSQPMREFLAYHDTIKGQSGATVDSYYLDLRTFTRWLYISRGLVPRDTAMEDIDISGASLELYGSVTLAEVYDFLAYLSRDRELNAASRARMITTLKGFYKYFTIKTKALTTNPVETLDAPKLQKSLPRYLTLEESQRLLSAVDGKNKERDYCILCLFLNCGLRISEMRALDLSDIREDCLLIHGKGNKERMVYLNSAAIESINSWLAVRKTIAALDENAVFLSNRRKRMSVDAIQVMVHNTLLKAGLDAEQYSPHKLRHTAATLMLQNGVDVRTLQEVLGHENLNTTQIYTHIANEELQYAAAANPLAEFRPEDKTDE